MLTLTQLQTEMRPWCIQNFGQPPSWYPLLGVQEEVGELSHAYLKRAQGIRGTPEEHNAAIRDACGDILIFLANFANLVQMQLPELNTIEVVENEDESWRSLLKVQESMGGIAVAFLKLTKTASEEIFDHYFGVMQNHIRNLIEDLIDFCHLEGIDLQQVLETTWAEVSKRNWKANPNNGAQP